MRIFLVRHAKDDDRYRGGWSDLDLTNDGIIQAQEVAFFLHEKQSKYQIKKIFSSDLLRAKHTADIINEKLKIEIEYSPHWREINNGNLSGMDNKIAEIKYPNLYFGTLEMNEKYPNGESPFEFYQRIKKNFDDLCESIADADNILLVTHGGVINIIYHLLNNIEWSNKKKSFAIAHGSIHIAERINKEFKIGSINDYENKY